MESGLVHRVIDEAVNWCEAINESKRPKSIHSNDVTVQLNKSVEGTSPTEACLDRNDVFLCITFICFLHRSY